jgi:CheY-like chemotaxis protein
MATILIVDDNADARQSLSMLLSIQGHVVQTVEDGGVAMAIMAITRPDLVILDLFMPRINGWEFLDSKAHSIWADVPVLVLTGWGGISQPIPENSGVKEVLDKSIHPKDLIDKIHEILEPRTTTS